MYRPLVVNLILIFSCIHTSYAQMTGYKFIQEISMGEDQWHLLKLPMECYRELSSNLSDIRVFRISTNKDTIETAYVLNKLVDKIVTRDLPIDVINETQKDGRQYHTFLNSTNQTISSLNLNIPASNFDLRLKVEGGQNNEDWFNIIDDYRVLSLLSKDAKYKHTLLEIPPSNYNYLRVSYEVQKGIRIESATIAMRDTSFGDYLQYKPFGLNNNLVKGNSVISIQLSEETYLCELSIDVLDKIDYYRKFSLEYVSDSSYINEKWQYHYSILSGGVLSSLENAKISFPCRLVQSLKLIVFNEDNQALQIANIQGRAVNHSLTIRSMGPGRYFLCYGKENDRKPNYDLTRFKEKIPKEIKEVSLGERMIQRQSKDLKGEIRFHKYWLWIIMVSLITLIGIFGIKLLREGNTRN